MSPQPTRRPVRAAALLAVLGLSLGLVACSDADDSAEVVGEGSAESTTTVAGGDAEDTTTTDGTDESTTTEGADDTTTTTEGGGASSDLSAVLLTVDDLPAGHVQDGEDDTTDTSMDEDEPLCAGSVEVSFPTPVEQIERSFQTEDYSSLIGSFAARFDGDEIEDGLGFYRSELERCGGTTDDDYTYEWRELSGIGDEALEIALTSSTAPESGVAYIYFARVDDVLVGVSVFAEDTAGIDGESLLALSASRG